MSLLKGGQSARPGADVLVKTLDQANDLVAQGKADDAVRLLRTLAAQVGPHKLVLKAIAVAEKAAGNMNEALQVYDQSLRLDNTQADVWVALGLCYLDIGNLRRAEECLQAAVQIDSRYFDARLQLARLFTLEAKFSEAFAQLDTAMALAPTAAAKAQVAHARGMTHSANGDCEAALSAAQEARKIDGNKSLYWQFEARCMRDVADPDGAYVLLARLLANGDTAAATYALALQCLRELGRSDKFKEVLSDAVAAHPETIEILEIQIAQLAADGQVDAALQCIKRAITACPAREKLHYMLIDKLIKQGRLDDALAAVAEARAAIPFMPRRRSIELLAGRLESKHGNHDLGLRLLQPVSQVQDGLGHQARVEAVRTLLRKGDVGQAEELTTAMLRMSDHDQLALAYRALIWRELRLPKSDWLIDYQNHIHVSDLPVPGGYRGIDDLNAHIAKTVKRLHFETHDPLNPINLGAGSSARGLFYRKEKPLADLKSTVLTMARRFLQTLPDDDSHPLMGRRTQQIRISDSIALKVATGAAVASHMNKRGWLNFVYYLDVPAAAANPANREGNLLFGMAPLTMKQVDAPARSVAAKSGRLIIFPGFLWRSVLPFGQRDDASAAMLLLAGSIEPA